VCPGSNPSWRIGKNGIKKINKTKLIHKIVEDRVKKTIELSVFTPLIGASLKTVSIVVPVVMAGSLYL
jgi:hypothetical protein